MDYDTDILIIGGGLAGLIAGIHLSQQNIRVILIEKQAYPQHKVCGEYVSNEVLPYLRRLGIDVDELNPSRIHRFLFSTVAGKTVESRLPLGGFGISRYTFDYFLYQKATSAGVHVCQDQVVAIQFENDAFRVSTAGGKTYMARVAIGAYGKRSVLDKQLKRAFMLKESPWIGVKAHYQATFSDDLVSLHNFDGGYCGLCQVENNVVNACYLTSYDSFKKHKNVLSFQRQVMGQNPFLQEFFDRAIPLFEKPITISQISFAKKLPVEQHILMCGDTAGVIHPLCGNGMAMAIHGAKLACELIIAFFQRKIESRWQLEKQYTAAWNQEFKNRLAMGRIVQSLLQRSTTASVLLKSLQLIPDALPLIIRQTHGTPLTGVAP